MRRVRRVPPRRGARRSFMANVNPNSVNIGNVSRSIRSKLKEIKSYQVPRLSAPQTDSYSSYYDNEGDYGRGRDSAAYGSDRFVKPASYGSPREDYHENRDSREDSHRRDYNGISEQERPMNQGQGSYYGNNSQSNQDARYGYAPQKSYYEYDNVQDSRNQQAVSPAPVRVANNVMPAVQQNRQDDYYREQVARVVHLEPDEEYILSVSGQNRKVSTLAKRVSDSVPSVPSAQGVVYNNIPSIDNQNQAVRMCYCPYCGREKNVADVRVYQGSEPSCNCDTKAIKEVKEVCGGNHYVVPQVVYTHAQPVQKHVESTNYHCCSNEHHFTERDCSCATHKVHGQKKDKRPRAYNIYIY